MKNNHIIQSLKAYSFDNSLRKGKNVMMAINSNSTLLTTIVSRMTENMNMNMNMGRGMGTGISFS